MLDWIKQGNNYQLQNPGRSGFFTNPDVPDHPQLSAERAGEICPKFFPLGVLYERSGFDFLNAGTPPDYGRKVGDGLYELLPGLYEYRREGDKRVPAPGCRVVLDYGSDASISVALPFGETFTIQLVTYHQKVSYIGRCGGAFYRIED